MAQILVVSYDLSNPGQNYEDLLKKIKAYTGWARLGGSAYLIYTDDDPVRVRDNLTTVLDKNDSLFVGMCPRPSAWYGLSEEVANWIHKFQK
jgi:hypothetical protein